VRRSQIDVSSHAFIGDGGDTAGAVKRYNHKTKTMGSTMGSLGMGKLHGKSPKVSVGLNLVVGEAGKTPSLRRQHDILQAELEVM
jgi:hypothetical protein